jgi:hypothetical protein
VTDNLQCSGPKWHARAKVFPDRAIAIASLTASGYLCQANRLSFWRAISHKATEPRQPRSAGH